MEGKLKYSYTGDAPKSTRGPSYYPGSDVHSPLPNFNGMQPSLNYQSSNLNRDNKANYNEFYPTSNTDARSGYKISSKHHSGGVSPRVPQYNRLHEGVDDNSFTHKSMDQVNNRQPMPNYKMAD